MTAFLVLLGFTYDCTEALVSQSFGGNVIILSSTSTLGLHPCLHILLCNVTNDFCRLVIFLLVTSSAKISVIVMKEHKETVTNFGSEWKSAYLIRAYYSLHTNEISEDFFNFCL